MKCKTCDTPDVVKQPVEKKWFNLIDIYNLCYPEDVDLDDMEGIVLEWINRKDDNMERLYSFGTNMRIKDAMLANDGFGNYTSLTKLNAISVRDIEIDMYTMASICIHEGSSGALNYVKSFI